jgi:hypothetical protein
MVILAMFAHFTIQSETLLMLTVAYLKNPDFILRRSASLLFSDNSGLLSSWYRSAVLLLCWLFSRVGGDEPNLCLFFELPYK